MVAFASAVPSVVQNHSTPATKTVVKQRAVSLRIRKHLLKCSDWAKFSAARAKSSAFVVALRLNSRLKNSHPCLFGGIGALASSASAQICPIFLLRPPCNHTNCAQKSYGGSSSTGC
jgi:hypothetical protein